MSAATLHIHAQFKYHVLHFLLSSPAFEDYLHCEDLLLQPPAPRRQLLSGKAHRTTQMPLKTVPIDESTYEGNSKQLQMNECVSQQGVVRVVQVREGLDQSERRRGEADESGHAEMDV
ncbi:hypothetical protein BOTBODRAFT_179229 [Botryobasidium botryosum FD-172 SS1]|uniref:DUF6589 domain-containing protein n=1 Tax=Botryobasidium botryosum (strain FD-172 SS1) TaxID=930990 RepID=A0A067M0F0_BOTB1|nr:hypothetical protein BOTBODRAFT_179229 [Botryobasidium botryosum FD-172 SS1]